MKKLALCVVMLLGGCAANPAPSAETGTTHRGELWTWDARENIVTLRQGTQTVRVKVTPEQIRQLQFQRHQNVTVRGELAGPAEIERITVPAVATVPVPRGAVAETEITGKVAEVDARGVLSIQSARGPLRVWAASPDPGRFPAGSDVRVRIAVQAVELVPANQASAAAPPAASVSSEPGDYAVVTGAIVGVEPSGTMTVESPRGPISVWVPEAAGYRAGQSVQVRTSVHPAS